MSSSTFVRRNRKQRPTSFTLVELLVVICIILILTALTLWAVQVVQTQGARSRAQSEISALSLSLENYKIDNGVYPPCSYLLGSNSTAYGANPDVAGGSYQKAAQVLYEALSGKVNFNDTSLISGSRSYQTFTANQLGNSTAAAGAAYAASSSTYVKDPWSYAYGYSTGDNTSNNVPNTGTNFFDLWSTAGTTLATTAGVNSTNTWITNWKNR